MPTTPPDEPKNGRSLSPASQAAVDRLLEQGLDRAPPAATERDPHDAALRQVLGLLDLYPVEDASDTLIDATLARVDRHEAMQEERMQVSAGETPGVLSRWRMPDVIATAAALFLAVGIGWPLWRTLQNHRIQGTSEAHLAGIGGALGSFALDNDGRLPLDHSLFEGAFDPINQPHSSHLLNTLPKGGYLDRTLLFLTPATTGPASFSYRVPAEPTSFRLTIIGPRSPLAGDQNPIIWHLRAGRSVHSTVEGSPTHAGRGQIILLGDLSTHWDDVATHARDPIWTAQSCPSGTAPVCLPASPGDVFLAD